MKCLKFNAKSTKSAHKAMVELSELGLNSIGRARSPLCVVFWSDKDYCGVNHHEIEPSVLAQSTEFFTKRKEFIEAVKRVLGESK